MHNFLHGCEFEEIGRVETVLIAEFILGLSNHN